jgi:glucose-6-phosphate isomerase
MSLALNFTYAGSKKLGGHGIPNEMLKPALERASKALEHVRSERKSGKLPYLDLPEDRKTDQACREMAEKFEGFENFLLAGIGGSSLGPLAIFNALGHPLHNLLSNSKRKNRPRFFTLDNVDPVQADALFSFCKPEKTVYNIISKSGATAETAGASLIIFDALKKKLGSDWKKNLVCTTDPETGDLRKLCNTEKLQTLPLHPGVGGRFSVLTPVGLFPSYCLGFDVAAMLAGAAEMREKCLDADVSKNPAANLAALLYLFDSTQHKRMHVMMAYANGLFGMADWFRQLWAESLGKELDLEGKPVYVGPTPLKALGATDQHSQVQLYIEGPHDKVFLFLEVKKFAKRVKFPSLYGNVSSLDYLGGQTMNKLIAAEFTATREALAQRNRPSVTITFPEVDAHAVGEFFMLWEMTTSIAGALYRINPYDQPGVELGKVLTYGLMGRAGFEDKAKGIKV